MEVASDPRQGWKKTRPLRGATAEPCRCPSPPPKSQSSKNRCRYPYGGCLQNQKGVAPPCLTETPTTSNQPSSGNFGVKRGLGCWRGRKRFGMAGCPMKHRRSIPSSPGVLLSANDCVPYGRFYGWRRVCCVANICSSLVRGDGCVMRGAGGTAPFFGSS